MSKASPHGPVIELVLAFNEALNRRDLDGMMRMMTADCLFENTAPRRMAPALPVRRPCASFGMISSKAPPAR